MNKLLLLLATLCSAIFPSEQQADLIIFSYHRPLQLHAVVSSVERYVRNVNQLFVLYRTDNELYERAYEELKALFPTVCFIKQGSNPRADFKPLFLQCLHATDAEYVMFGVDDDMFKDHVDLAECIAAMEQSDAYGFYMRLGKNIAFQYGKPKMPLALPKSVKVGPSIFKYQFSASAGDWRYPHSLDMVLYKKSDIERDLNTLRYSSPNTLEGTWAGVADFNRHGLFFETSKQFTLPLNMVQKDGYSTHENSHSAAELFTKWQRGLIMDISLFDKIKNDCPFMGYSPAFVSCEALKVLRRA